MKNISDLTNLSGDELLKALGFTVYGNSISYFSLFDLVERTTINFDGIYINLITFLRDDTYQGYSDVRNNLIESLKPYLDEVFDLGCPKEGEFYGYKLINLTKELKRSEIEKAEIGLVTLKIPKNSKRVSPYSFGNKCRCEYAIVEKIQKMKIRMWFDLRTNVFRFFECYFQDGEDKYVSSGYSFYDPNIEYKVGEIIRADTFDDNPWRTCSNGINFFLKDKSAKEYLHMLINSFSVE